MQAGIEIHACQISMGLDWMPSGRQSSISSGSSRISSSSSSSSSSIGSCGSKVVVMVAKAAAVVCGSDLSTPVRAFSNLYCCPTHTLPTIGKHCVATKQ